MITTKQAEDIIDVILDYVEVAGTYMDEAYPDISPSDKDKVINIIKDMIGEIK